MIKFSICVFLGFLTTALCIAEFNGVGTYPIYDNSYYQLIGGDVISLFGFTGDSTGSATIKDFDEPSRIFLGSFSFELTASRDFNNVKSGETFTINGRFKSRIEKIEN